MHVVAMEMDSNEEQHLSKRGTFTRRSENTSLIRISMFNLISTYYTSFV